MPRSRPRLSTRPVARPVRALAALAMVGLVLAGCGGDGDISADTFATDLRERANSGVPDDGDEVMSEAVAECITEGVYDTFDQAEVNRIYHAADEDELGNETRDALFAINQECYSASVASSADDDEGDGSSSTTTEDVDGSTTTTAEDGSTTTEG